MAKEALVGVWELDADAPDDERATRLSDLLEIERDGLDLNLYAQVVYEDTGEPVPRTADARWVARVILESEPPDWGAVVARHLPDENGVSRFTRIWLDGLSDVPGRLILPRDGRWRGQDVGFKATYLTGARENPAEHPLEIREVDGGVRPYAYQPGDGTTHLVLDGFSGGDGSPGDPFLIHDVDDLQAANDDLSAHYRFANDIDASATETWNGGAGFLPIGRTSPYFSGLIDGAGFTLSGLVINRPAENFTGLVGRGSSDALALVTDLTLTDCTISGGAYTGGVVGHTGSPSNATLTNCTISGGTYTGGVLGFSGSPTNATLTGCTISGDSRTGGVVGYSGSPSNATLTNCTISGSTYIGGVVGLGGSPSNATLTGCTISGTSYTGGMVGDNGSPSNATLAGCAISGSEHTGGVVGYTGAATRCQTTNCAVTATDHNAGGIGGLRVSVTDCAVIGGSVEAPLNVGGLLGDYDGASPRVILRSYSTATVLGNANVGGLAGIGGDITDSFCANEVEATGSEPGNVAAVVGQSNGTISNVHYWQHPDTPEDAIGERVAGTGDPVGRADKTTFWDVSIESGAGEPYYDSGTTSWRWDFDAVWSRLLDEQFFPLLRAAEFSIEHDWRPAIHDESGAVSGVTVILTDAHAVVQATYVTGADGRPPASPRISLPETSIDFDPVAETVSKTLHNPYTMSMVLVPYPAQSYQFPVEHTQRGVFGLASLAFGPVLDAIAAVQTHGDAIWATATGFSTHSAGDAGTDAASKILATPAQKLATDASGHVTASNMRGTDGAAQPGAEMALTAAERNAVRDGLATGANVSDLQTHGDANWAGALTTEQAEFLRSVRAFARGRVTIADGVFTFYDTDGTTPLFTMTPSAAGRTVT